MKLNDKILKDALLDAAAEDFADILEGNITDIEFSEEYLAKKQKLLCKPIKRSTRWKKILSQAAVFAVVIITLLCSSRLSMTASAQGFYGISKGFKDTLVYTRDDSYPPTAETGRWSAEYLPEGYMEASRDETQDFCSVHYVNGTKLIDFIYFHTSAYMNIKMNTGSSYLEPVLVNGEAALFHRAEKDGMNNVLMWFSNDGKLVFMLDAALPSEELVKIAESVTLE